MRCLGSVMRLRTTLVTTLSAAATTAAVAGSALPPPGASPPHPVALPAKKPARVEPIDINSASARKLATLPGIGAAEAARIVAGRPYSSKADIVAKASIPAGVYVAIKHQIVAARPPIPSSGPTR